MRAAPSPCDQKRRGTESNRRMEVLQTSALPLGYRAGDRKLLTGIGFRNPPPGVSSLKAWELIDAAGCRGLTRGGAVVSDKHCNFLINAGGAMAADLEGLGEEVRRRVFAASGVSLDWEIHRIGVPARGPEVVA